VSYDYTTLFFIISSVSVGALPRKPRGGLIAAPSTPASVFFIVLGSALGRWTGAGPTQDRVPLDKWAFFIDKQGYFIAI